MRDEIKLQIGNKEISTFLSYEVDSNVLVPADAFSVKVSRIDNSMKEGEEFKLYVNRTIEMTGIIDKITPSYSKGSQEMVIEGRDFMGLLIDISVEEWKTIKGMDLKKLAAKVLKNVPYLNKSKIIYGSEIEDIGTSSKRKGVSVKKMQNSIFNDTSTNTCQFQAGISIFDALSDYSQRHGLLMWMEPDGTLVFGTLKGPQDSESPAYSFYCYKSGDDRQKNNIISASNPRDLSKRYSKITTVAQIQGSDSFDVGGHDVKKTATDATFPFTKPLVLQSGCGSARGAKYQAEWEVKRREVEGWRVEYTTSGHSQDGLNYRANRVCYIKDEVLGIDGSYLVLGRKLTMDRQTGPKTVLTIGKLMEGYAVN